MWTSVLLFQVSSACLYRLGSVEYNLSTLHHTTFYEVHDKEIDSDFFSLAYGIPSIEKSFQFLRESPSDM